MNETCYLLLGTNLGDRLQHLLVARDLLNRDAGRIVRTSAIYATAPWGKEDQPEFLNQALEMETDRSAGELLAIALQIEHLLGRHRSTKWEARVIDIDILFYGRHIIHQANLVVPHPRLPDRRFALVPLAELAKDWVHPVLKKTVQQLLSETTDTLEVTPYKLKGSWPPPPERSF